MNGAANDPRVFDVSGLIGGSTVLDLQIDQSKGTFGVGLRAHEIDAEVDSPVTVRLGRAGWHPEV